ncbi:endonuclease/exonuclease/phosphatase family protein [bacterium]|nr:endonuclease/exonuclease/phosphatase family protein [bacterium]
MKKSVLLLTLFSLNAYAGPSVLCDQISHNQISFSAPSLVKRDSTELTLVTWNAHKLADKKYMPDLVQLSQDSDLILIQEAMHSDNLQNSFAAQFNMSFSFHKSFCNGKKHATGVMTGSRYELSNNLTIVSPDTEPFTFTPKVSGYSMIHIPEIGTVHVINTHGLNFNLGNKFARQINHLAQFMHKLEGPIIWAGDFNTWSPDRKDHLYETARILGMTHLKPSNDSRTLLKLDHVFVRGLEAVSSTLLDNYKSSDHAPIKIVLKKK